MEQIETPLDVGIQKRCGVWVNLSSLWKEKYCFFSWYGILSKQRLFESLTPNAELKLD